MNVDPDGNSSDFWSAFWKYTAFLFGMTAGFVIGGLVLGVPGAIVGAFGGAILTVEAVTIIETECYVSHNMVNAEYTLKNPEETWYLDRNEALAYIRYLRSNDQTGKYKDWTEGQMFREWEYHKRAYLIFHKYDKDDKHPLTNHAKFVDFEEKQTVLTYWLRFIGNLLF